MQASTKDLSTTLINDVHVYAMADYYQIWDLKEAAKLKFTGVIDRGGLSAEQFADVITEVRPLWYDVK